MRPLESQDWHVILHALRVAARAFDEDAKAMKEAGHIGMVRTFEDQSKTANKLADEIEEAEGL